MTGSYMYVLRETILKGRSAVGSARFSSIYLYLILSLILSKIGLLGLTVSLSYPTGTVHLSMSRATTRAPVAARRRECFSGLGVSVTAHVVEQPWLGHRPVGRTLSVRSVRSVRSG